MTPARKRASYQYWIYDLDLSVWNFTLSRFITELDCVIYIDLGFDTYYLSVNWD